MISPFEAKMFVAACAVAAPVAISGIVAWTFVRVRRPPAGVPDARAAAVEERLARMEQAIDALTLEVERSGEAQRFTARLLAERLGDLPARVPERVPERAIGGHRPSNTPH